MRNLLVLFLALFFVVWSGCATTPAPRPETPDLPQFDYQLSDHTILGEIVWIDLDAGQAVVLLDTATPSDLGDFLVAHDGAFSLTAVLLPGGPRTDHSLGLRIDRGRPEIGNEVIIPGSYLRRVLGRPGPTN